MKRSHGEVAQVKASRARKAERVRKGRTNWSVLRRLGRAVWEGKASAWKAKS